MRISENICLIVLGPVQEIVHSSRRKELTRKEVRLKIKETLTKHFDCHLCSSAKCLLLKFISNFVSDIDECMERINGVISKGGCQHKCNNTIGSYICSCNEGFASTSDKKACKGRKYFK